MTFTVTILCIPAARTLTFDVNAPGLSDARKIALQRIVKQKHYVVASVKKTRGAAV